ncbi:MAG: hypothetical protein ACYDCX_03600 [Acidithiobacillus sp.]
MRSHSPSLVISPLGILAMSLCAALPGDADAMDCNKASIPTERTICGDKKLLLLDRDLTVVYDKFIKTFSDHINEAPILENTGGMAASHKIQPM